MAFASARLHSSARLDGVATALGLVGENFGRMHELTSIEHAGDHVFADACERLPEGMVVSVGFEARGIVARRGVVMSCAALDRSYRVAIQLEASPAC
ncbi:MAG: hypothetical protein SGJ09_07720 [Phycisphaerae bacterium]|nr:hypothetical protein [Phycisphaerae bacterium]